MSLGRFRQEVGDGAVMYAPERKIGFVQTRESGAVIHDLDPFSCNSFRGLLQHMADFRFNGSKAVQVFGKCNSDVSRVPFECVLE